MKHPSWISRLRTRKLSGDLREVSRNYYARVPLADALAAERTLLAAERTFLAYVRTAFAMVVVGLTGAQLLEDPLLVGVGYLLSGLSGVVLVLGVVRFIQSRRATLEVLRRNVSPDLTRDEEARVARE